MSADPNDKIVRDSASIKSGLALLKQKDHLLCAKETSELTTDLESLFALFVNFDYLRLYKRESTLHSNVMTDQTQQLDQISVS